MSLKFKFLIVSVILGCCLSSIVSAQEVINTWINGTASLQRISEAGGAVTQRFTVPAGKMATKVEIYVEKHGSYYQQAGYYANMALFPAGSASPIAVRSVEFIDPQWLNAVGDFLSVSTSDLVLPPGQYDLQLWGNTSVVSERMFARLYTGSVYDGGDARTGYAPGTPIGGDTDFAARLTIMDEFINTWEGGTASFLNIGLNGGYITQRFTVPDRQICTKVQIWAEKHGSWYQQAGYYANIALYAVGSTSAIAVRSVAFTDPQWLNKTGDFISLSTSDLALAPGQYDIQLWGNTSTVSSRLYGKLYTGSTYTGGDARTGAAPGTPIGNNTDFAARLAVIPQPKLLMDVAPIGWYDSRWGDQYSYPDLDERMAICNEKAAALHNENCQIVLPYLSGVDFATYQRHIWAVGNQRMKLIFEFHRGNIRDEYYDGIGAYLNSYKSSWSVNGWYTFDEPSIQTPPVPVGTLENVYDFIDADNVKPVYVAFSGGEVLNGQPQLYRDTYDVMLMDNYPILAGHMEFQNIASWKNVIAATKAASQDVGKPWWSIIQAMGSGWGQNYWRLPSYNEERFMVYWSVLEDATGVLFFMHDAALQSVAQPAAVYPYSGQQWIQDVSKPISREYLGCAAAIAGGAVPNAVQVNNADIVAKVYKSAVGEYILIAANQTTGAKNVTLTLNLPAALDPNDDPTLAIEFGQTVSIADISAGTLSASFDSYGVRVYRLMATDQVINTYAEGAWAWWKAHDSTTDPNNPHIAPAQWFEVPQGTIGTQFEFFAEIGSAPRSSAYHCNVQVFQEDGTLVATGVMTADQFPSPPVNNAWVPVTGLNLNPGRYYAQMLTNEPGFKGYLHARIVTNSLYGDGFAANGWSGGATLQPRDDFWTRLTVIPSEVRQVQGTVTLQNYQGDLTAVPVTMAFKDPLTHDILETHTVNLGADGSYALQTILAAGTYDLTAKAPHWLRQQAAAAIPGTANFVLINGDADADNTVALSDVLILSNDFLQSGSAVPGDMNGDGFADLGDFAVMADAWQLAGE